MGQEIIPIAEWRPDMPDLAEATSIALNVVPVTAQSYGPLPSLTPYSLNAMDGTCIGAISASSEDLVTSLFTGTDDKLYQMPGYNHGNIQYDSAGNIQYDSDGNIQYDSAGFYSAGFADVSGGAYTTGPGENWRFEVYDYTVIATNFSDPMQSFKLSSSSVFANLFAAPAWEPSHAYSVTGAYVLANGSRYTLIQAGTSSATGTGPSGTGSGIADGINDAPAWENGTSYTTVGQQVSANGNIYALAAPGTSSIEGTGPSGTGSGIVDGVVAPAWAASTVYGTLGQLVSNGGNVYELVQAGTSAGSGGPTGTGVDIIDNSCLWNYVTAAACEWNFFAATAAIWNYQSSPPPLARFLCTPKDFLMVGNTSDPVGGLAPQRIWWSASGDPTTWPAPGSDAAIENMSDFNDFQGDFQEMTGLVDSLANADVAIFFRHAVWRGLFVGPPDVFDFFPAENVRGCPAPNSIIPLGNLVAYLGEDGFYVFDGAQSTPLGVDKFDAWFWNNVNQAFLYNVVGAPNVPGRAYLWAFPSTASPDGSCDTILIYRWDIQRASYANVGQGAVEWMLRSLSFGVTMDGMFQLGFTDVDTLPASLDSPVWIGGAAQLAAINSAHQLAYFNGPNMAAQVATQTKQLTPGRRTYVQSARPLVDLTEGTPSVAFAARVDLYSPETFGDAVEPDISGECPQRSDGRYHNAMIELPEGAVWTHIVGVDTTFVPGGYR